MNVVATAYRRSQQLVHEIAKFGIVGAINAVLDIALFNTLHFGLGVGPLTSKLTSTVAATTSSYFMNRYWSFRHRERSGLGREYGLFFLLNGVALLIALACLGFTRYVLGFDTVLALNLSGNVIGLGLGTVFRFWAYRRWVFLEAKDAEEPVPIDAPSALAADWLARHPHASYHAHPTNSFPHEEPTAITTTHPADSVGAAQVPCWPAVDLG